MKRYLTSITVVIVGMLLLATSSYARSKYDFMLKHDGIQKQINFYDTQIKTNPLFMDYLNEIVSSPKALYMALDDHDCEKEILRFVEKNKSFTVKLIHIRAVIIMNGAGVTDNELRLVGNYLKNPRAMVATNAQEMGMETAFMRNMPSFMLYELFTKPGGFKDQVEEMFHSVAKANNR